MFASGRYGVTSGLRRIISGSRQCLIFPVKIFARVGMSTLKGRWPGSKSVEHRRRECVRNIRFDTSRTAFPGKDKGRGYECAQIRRE